MTMQANIVLTNVSGASQTLGFKVTEPSSTDVTFSTSVPGDSVTIPPNGSASVVVWMQAAKAAKPGHKQALLEVVSAGGAVARAMLYAFVK